MLQIFVLQLSLTSARKVDVNLGWKKVVARETRGRFQTGDALNSFALSLNVALSCQNFYKHCL